MTAAVSAAVKRTVRPGRWRAVRRRGRSLLMAGNDEGSVAGAVRARRREPRHQVQVSRRDPVGPGAGGTPGGQHTGLGASCDEPAPPNWVGQASLRSVATRSHPVR
jgi:hypothetical protein